MFWMSGLLAVRVQVPNPGGVPEGSVMTAKGNPFSNVLLLVSVAV